jgi:hypothetical protein
VKERWRAAEQWGRGQAWKERQQGSGGRCSGGEIVAKRQSDGGCGGAVAKRGEVVAADAAAASSYTASKLRERGNTLRFM